MSLAIAVEVENCRDFNCLSLVSGISGRRVRGMKNRHCCEKSAYSNYLSAQMFVNSSRDGEARNILSGVRFLAS
jgi:hypothetical protein